MSHLVTLLVVRHGEAEGNREHRFIGQSDTALSELGRYQAEAVARRLAGLPITHIVSSDLGRAMDTIAPLAEAVGVPVTADERLREIANGDWTGLLPDEIAARWPEIWARYRAGEDVQRPQGESWQDVRRRVTAAAQDIIGDAAEGDLVVLSTHAGPALSLLLWAAGVHESGNIFSGPFSRIDNGSISTIVAPGPRLAGVNDVGHLRPAPAEFSGPLGRLDQGRPFIIT
ncbi:MAG: histidine phosphatase family protein [Acidimicrobiia bacterium]